MAAPSRIGMARIGMGGLAAALALGTLAAQAQNPSADQIINSLKPTGGMLGGTRGIRPVGPSAPAEAAPTPAAGAPHATHAAAKAPAAAPATTSAAPSVNLNVQFLNGSSELTPAAMRTLDQLGTALSSQALASYRFRIEGHTDTVGGQAANKALSDARAAAVVNYLSSKFKIDPTRLTAVGMGEEGLLVPTGPNTAEPRNRRVQVVNVGA